MRTRTIEMRSTETLIKDSIQLLKELIAIPSFSKEENKTADLIERFLTDRGVDTFRRDHNVWAYNKHYDAKKPTILLNSHHDTVQPNPAYTRDPFSPEMEGDILYGLGSNDAGGCLVSLIAVFLHYFPKKDLTHNICLAATGEEEISGVNGIESILTALGPLSFAIVGEPTLMQLAVAERGLMVLDCRAHGKAGHAARNEGENALYKAMDCVNWFRNYQFPKISEQFGPMKMNVTMIHAGLQHNVVPAVCDFVVDIRIIDLYSHEEVLEIIRQHVDCEISPRSLRLKSSSIALDHPIVRAGISIGKTTYGSPTTSDQAFLNIPSLKLGPGDSARSHMADEFIYMSEIERGIEDYIQIVDQVIL